MKIGILGCGKISSAYLGGCKQFPDLEIVHCADLLPERAQAQAAEFGVPRSGTVEELLGDPEVEMVINLTVPLAHGETNRAILNAGKHVFCEKPFMLNREEGAGLAVLAREKNLRIGSAPDTFLGEGHQTCRKVIDDGAIGRPVAATAFMACHGHESWHPNPAFYYQPGGGPMFDMGPYYLTALVNMIGPISRVSGFTKTTFKERIATAPGIAGMKIEVTTPTHFSGTAEFANGALLTLIMSFDIWAHNLPILQVYGTEGTLNVPDPNGAGGTPSLYTAESGAWQEVPHSTPPLYTSNYNRGAGVADMARSIASGTPHRANGEVALHVVEAMEAFLASDGSPINLTTTAARPAPYP